MNYVVTYNNKEINAKIEEIKPFEYNVTIDSKEFIVDAHKTTSSVFSFIVDGKSYEADVTETADVIELLINGLQYKMEIIEEKKKRLMRVVHKTASDGKEEIKAPMPGKVVKILKKAGDEVKAGEGVIVVEAMKMENELKASVSGMLKNVYVEEGQAVEAGLKLVEIEQIKTSDK